MNGEAPLKKLEEWQPEEDILDTDLEVSFQCLGCTNPLVWVQTVLESGMICSYSVSYFLGRSGSESYLLNETTK
jgi:hypothetical protein